MLPRVILYNAVSIDGRTGGFPVDLGQFYQLASQFSEDATLVGCDTLLSGGVDESMLVDEADRDPGLPLLVATDSRGRMPDWAPWRRMPFWRDVVVLCSQATPEDYVARLRAAGIDHTVAGDDHVDLRSALGELADRFGVETVRADCGGRLNGALLRAGLVSELALLVHPCLVGGAADTSIFRLAEDAEQQEPLPARLLAVEQLEGGLLWLRYEVG